MENIILHSVPLNRYMAPDENPDTCIQATSYRIGGEHWLEEAVYETCCGEIYWLLILYIYSTQDVDLRVICKTKDELFIAKTGIILNLTGGTNVELI